MAPRLVVTERGASIFWGDRDLYPGLSPEAHAESKASQVIIHPHCLYVVFSPLLGHGVLLLKDRLPDSSLLITLEEDPQLEGLTRHIPGIRHFSPGSPLVLASLGGGLRGIRTICLVSLNGARLYQKSAFADLDKRLNFELRTWWRNRSTILYHGRRWMRNILDNLRPSSSGPSLNSTHALPVDKAVKAVVFCAAGPSLEESLDHLKAHRQEIALLCADTAIPVLLGAGLVPDICIILEGQHHNLEDFSYYGLPSSMCVWADLTAHGSTMRWMKRQGLSTWFFMSGFTDSAMLTRMATMLKVSPIPALGSVGVTGLYLASSLALGSSLPLLLCGTDFQNQAGKTHARNSPGHLKGLRTLRREKPHGWLSTAWHGVSDPVLGSYGELAQEVLVSFGKNSQFLPFDMRSHGYPLEIRVMKDQWDSLFTRAEAKSLDALRLAGMLASAEVIGKAGLIEKFGIELNRLDLLAQDGADSEEFQSAIESLDLFFMDFPDTEWPPVSREAIARIRLRILEIKEFLVEFVSHPLRF